MAQKDASDALAVRQKVENFLNAARAGNLDLFKKLAVQLDEEGKGLKKTVEDIKDANKRGALHFAAREGRTDVCKYIIEELKLEVDTKDEDGETPLLHAARQGHIDTAKYLIECGASPDASSELGATALHHVAGTGNIELLQYILGKGADVESQSDAGTPLIWAAGHGKQEAVKILLKYHADPNAETDDGITPLLSAVAAGSFPCLELLIQSALLKCVSSSQDGLKPIQVAAQRSNRSAVEVLLPVTSPVQVISNWSIDGIIEHMQSDGHKDQERPNVKEADVQEIARAQKQEMPEVTQEAKEKSLEAKARGEDAFRRKDYRMAVDAYTQAFDLDPSNAALLSNRSLCWVRLGQADHALADAKACRALKPEWAKGCYREGAALRLLQRFEEAANAFYEGVQLDPENKELVIAFREAVEAGRKFHGTDQPKA
ncbi:hypothetical protein IFM89_021304 [Coptis chinensis]|uniref:Serine/threonine-protein kinase BSK1-like TPR repeats domain-containing protein n=1 Tax=Coptis chinensis TaxID=261450 RepID=A0A835LS01_9MAGN|nr:hypothetical protein IFM89_021304 [Coptis chinensis]